METKRVTRWIHPRTRGNFNPGEMLDFAQQAKASLPLYSERFMPKASAA